MVKVPIPEVKGYVIFNPENGLFSSGGTEPSWRKKPKIWNNIGHLKNHLHLAIGPHHGRYEKKIEIISTVYNNCIIIDITTNEPYDLDIYQFILDKWKDSYAAKNGYTLKYV